MTGHRTTRLVAAEQPEFPALGHLAPSEQSELPAQLDQQPIKIPFLVDDAEEVAVGSKHRRGMRIEEAIHLASDDRRAFEAHASTP